MSQPYTFSATRNSSVRAVARDSGRVSVEAKVLQRIQIGWDVLGARDRDERSFQVLRQRGSQLHRLPGRGVTESEPCCVQEMSFRGKRNQSPPAAPTVGIVSDHWVPQ